MKEITLKVKADGRVEWWEGYFLHRMDGPAFIFPNGVIQYWKNGSRVSMIIK